MDNKCADVLLFLTLFLCVLCSFAEDESYEPQPWNYTLLNRECDSPVSRSYCMDIRMCKPAVASLAMGGWPAVCGWVVSGIPRVCCSYPLVLGGALIRKVDEEKEKITDCQQGNCSRKVSETEQDFYNLLFDLPDVNYSDPSRFDPPLQKKGWLYTPFNANCHSPLGNSFCMDIRKCTSAVASIALGGWPSVCGWTDKIVLKVCCGFPLVLGKSLMKKVIEERKKPQTCGLPFWVPKLSKTELDFYRLSNKIPVMKNSLPSSIDPTLKETAIYGPVPGKTEKVISGEFPWMVSVQKNGKYLCGGSLLTATHVISAAHCFVSNWETLNPSNIKVYAGEVHIGYKYNVTKIFVHENFLPGQLYDDIAILTLETQVYTNLNPICLPWQEVSIKNLTGAKTTMLGWGFASFTGGSNYELQIISNISVVTNEECSQVNNSLVGRRLPRGITDDFICAGSQEGNRDRCQTDSGGPLMYKYGDYYYSGGYYQRWVLVGIVTFSVRCGDSGYPGIFTRVSSYVPWILKNISLQ